MTQNRSKLTKTRSDILAVLKHTIAQTNPEKVLKEQVTVKSSKLTVHGKTFDLKQYQSIYIVGGGKAVFLMAKAIEQMMGEYITAGHINVPQIVPGVLKKISCTKATHPIPSKENVEGAKKIRAIAEKARKDDLVIALISGGGSAMMCLPHRDISLEDKMETTSLLLKKSATIHEINRVRKHLSLIKGGYLATYASPATVLGLYISDIIDDLFDIQASGPTAPDTSTFADAILILKHHSLWDVVPAGVRRHLEAGMAGKTPETPKMQHPAFKKVFNYTLCNHRTALLAACAKAKELGYHVLPLTSSLQGEAREVALSLAAIGKEIANYDTPLKKPAMIIATGETTVHVTGDGQGGRNQELVLSACRKLLPNMVVASFGTDGVDGITPAPVAGAMADHSTLEKAQKRNMDIMRFLQDNDSYHFFKATDGHIITGPTGTNVGDVMVVVVT
ncbi:DUF4147 domain-containing protein [Candidatus Woesearchaeota archaeon]|nr:DUF4147 domain-containing protein [Candidatus Woesearchaeota archaeon]